MRINRLLSILLLLQFHKQLTTRELASMLNVSERTIQRDMEILSFEGLPVYSIQGRYGGWRLIDDYKTKISQLNKEEFPVLFVRLPEKVQQELGIDKDVELAQMKLLSILPEGIQRNAEYSAKRIYLDTPYWNSDHKPEQPFLSILITALWEEKKVLITYRRKDSQIRERLIDPLGLVLKGENWYLVASVDSEIRTYRTERIQSAQIQEVRFTRPSDFDLADYWKNSVQQFLKKLPQYQVEVEVNSCVLDQLSYSGRYPKIKQLELEDTKEWIRVSLLFQMEQEACAYIMGFGNQIKVLEPIELQRKIRNLAEEITKIY